jgi:gliding motility-associated-like protein
LTQSLTTVYPQPHAKFTATPTQVCLGDSIVFTDMSDGITSSPNKWYWNFQDGSYAYVQNPHYTYKDSGSFNVSLYIYNAQNCVSDTFISPVLINPYPVLDAGPDLFVLQGNAVRIQTTYYATNPQFLWTPPSYLDSDTVSNPNASPPNSQRYYVRLSGIGGCSVQDSVFIKVLFKPVIPNAFSPNGDGINDTWVIEYLNDYPGATVEVYDRSGRMIFRSYNYANPWDGTINGKPLPVGTYYYIIKPGFGRPLMSGGVTILR